ncbi:MAG TPA: biopolymer transporter ExbD [Bryobacteraceae bacterium]|nr:biopolymer transporter ExbD [Bryobacteraceae bacterium]
MGMSLGSNGRSHASINMTPMIDILLVLIIIFMVITPTTSHGLKALVPQPDSSSAASALSDDIVVTVNGNGTVAINRETIPVGQLSGRLQRVFANHPGHPLFVRGSKDLDFEPVAKVIDIARGIGLDRIALMTN